MAYRYSNNATGTLSAAIGPTDTVVTLGNAQAALFPAITGVDQFYGTFTDAASRTNREIFLVTSRTGNVLQVVRGQDGTTAQSWLIGDIVSQNVVAAELNDFLSKQFDLPRGIVAMWSGSVATIPTAWALCDGNNGTPNLLNRFVVCAGGGGYNVGDIGGTALTTLSLANLPPHNHGVNDPSHVHGVNDPQHIHPITDTGHSHILPGSVAFAGTTSDQEGTNTRILSFQTNPTTNVVATGIGINGAFTGISINAAYTGITTQNAGSGTPVSTIPPYYALAYIMKL